MTVQWWLYVLKDISASLGAPVSLTSVPEPGRKVLMLMVLPGAGNWASMIALINGCTRAGDRALRLSTSSNT